MMKTIICYGDDEGLMITDSRNPWQNNGRIANKEYEGKKPEGARKNISWKKKRDIWSSNKPVILPETK